jgi:hypothetical protein
MLIQVGVLVAEFIFLKSVEKSAGRGAGCGIFKDNE